MTFFGGLAQGAPRPIMTGASASRTDVLGRKYQTFTNPFFDLASTYTPPTVKALFGFTRHFHLSHGVISAINNKAAEYPITDLLLSHQDGSVVSKWNELMQGVLNYRTHQLEINLDYFVYGNAFVSPSLPFTKVLTCGNGSCNAEHNALKVRALWRYNNSGFWLACPRCGQSDWAKARDDYYPRVNDVSLIRWNPELIQLFYNEATGHVDYNLDFSAEFKNWITMGRKDLVATTPQEILEAVKSQRMLVFDRRAVYHLRRPGLSGMVGRWGVPLMMPVLKDALYMQIMKKAQEAVLLQHLVPQVFLFPQPATSGADPFCVSPDTLIEVPGGLVPAYAIQRGDLLRSHTGEWRIAEDVIARRLPKEEKAYRVVPYTLAGFPFTASEEHPIWAVKNPQRRHGQTFSAGALASPSFIEIKNLEKGDFVAYPVRRIERSEVVVDRAAHMPERAHSEEWIYARYQPSGIEIYEYLEENGIPAFKPGPEALLSAFLQEKGWERKHYESVRISLLANEAHRCERFITLDGNWARILGYFVAEGSTSDSAVAFAFNSAEIGYIDELQASLKAVGYESKVYPGSGGSNCSNVLVHDVLLAEFLRGFCGRYAADKRIPQEIAEAQTPLLIEFLRCLFNGDGTAIISDEKGTGRVSLKTTSPHIAIETRRLLLALGHIAGVSRTVPGEDERAKAPYYQVYCNGAEAVRLADRFHWRMDAAPTKRPERNAFIRDGYLYMRIREISEVECPEVIGFQMSGERSFCVAGVATHNTTTSLADWRDHIRRELARQRMDPAYYGILPFPLGHQTIGENGKSLLLMPEIQAMAEHICIGMGFPVDLVFGNGTYAGSSVNMRGLENFFLSNVQAHKRLVHWVMKHFSTFFDWPAPDAHFKAFRMADDLQRQQLLFQMSQAPSSPVSMTAVLAQTDLSFEDEVKLQLREAELNQELLRKKAQLAADIQGEQMMVMAKYQARGQAAAQAAATNELAGKKSPFDDLMQAGLNKPPGITLDAAAAALAKEIERMPPDRAEALLSQLRTQVPEMVPMLEQQQGAGLPAMPGDPMAQGGAQQPQGAQQQAPAVDMRPMPAVLPPRRQGGV